jgi:hypothetical protein
VRDIATSGWEGGKIANGEGQGRKGEGDVLRISGGLQLASIAGSRLAKKLEDVQIHLISVGRSLWSRWQRLRRSPTYIVSSLVYHIDSQGASESCDAFERRWGNELTAQVGKSALTREAAMATRASLKECISN